MASGAEHMTESLDTRLLVNAEGFKLNKPVENPPYWLRSYCKILSIRSVEHNHQLDKMRTIFWTSKTDTHLKRGRMEGV
jgi:hypothetical protein